jgi:S1-C subfamily serine protease
LDLINHVKSTWDHVLHGDSTVAEKAEVAVEGVAAAAALFAGGGKIASMFRAGEKALPSLELVGNTAEQSVRTSAKAEAFGKIFTNASLDREIAAVANRARVGETVIPVFRYSGTAPNLVPELTATRALANSAEAKLYANMSQAVVRVKAGQEFGSGFMLDARHIITDDHVALPNGRPSEIKVHLPDGTVHSGRMVARDGEADLAIVRLSEPAAQVTPIQLAGESDFSQIGKVAIVSHPGGIATPVISEGQLIEFQEGQLASKNRFLPEIHCSTAVMPGSSGGALCRVSDGKVLGILSGMRDGGTTSVSTTAPSIKLLQNLLQTAEKDGPLPSKSWVDARSFGKIWQSPEEGLQIKITSQSAKVVDPFDGLGLLRRRRYAG